MSPWTTQDQNTRSKEEALAAFVARARPRSTRCSVGSRRSATITSGHSPDEVAWAHVGTLGHYAGLLKRVTDSAFQEGEHA